MPSHSSMDAVPFMRRDPSVAVSNLFGLGADTVLSWNQRTPYPDFQPMAPVQLEAPQQAVVLPPEGIWAEMVVKSRKALEKARAKRANEANRPSRLFFGSTADGREFMMKSLQVEHGLRFHRY